MSRIVGDETFWDDRISIAKGRGFIHHSIYEASPQLWEAIEFRHKDIIFNHIDVNKPVLDIACGYGRFAKYFKSENYTGVDFSRTFITIAEEGNVEHTFIQSRIEKLPFQDQEFEWGFGVSIKAMIIREMGQDVWDGMELELRRVCKNLLFLEYSDGKGNHLIEDYEVIRHED